MGKSFSEYMEEERYISRWKVLIVGMTGFFAVACLMFIMMLLGFSA